MQSFEKWFPVDDIPAYLAGVFLLQHDGASVTLVCDGEFANDKLLVLRFNDVEAAILQEEFAHQWPVEPNAEPAPRSPGGYGAFPFLIMKNSAWARTSMKARRFGEVPTHYCILSGTDFIDVLALDPPRISWTTPAEIEAVMDAASKLGAA